MRRVFREPPNGSEDAFAFEGMSLMDMHTGTERPQNPADLDLRVRYQNVGALKPYAGNARTHSDKQIAQIAASIDKFGFNNPVLVDSDNRIVAGHRPRRGRQAPWPDTRADDSARPPVGWRAPSLCDRRQPVPGEILLPLQIAFIS